MIDETLPDWLLAIERERVEHEARLLVGARVRLVATECPHGTQGACGHEGRIIRICRADQPHSDPALYPYVGENPKGHRADHPFEVWVAGDPTTWWARAEELEPLADAPAPALDGREWGMATIRPVLVLDRQDVEWLLQAFGAWRHSNWDLSRDEYARVKLLSPAGLELLMHMQSIVRESED